MIAFEKFTLENGLRCLVHTDPNTPAAVLNVMYDVGSRDEAPQKTGFAHLFEHLMFGGSQNVDAYDTYLQRVGGDNNAFTSPDVTNYFLTVPAANLETGFWLESDRMLSLNFDPQVLEVQRKVVIEEFKQRYLNQPYGDMWNLLRPLAYQQHPYRWPTIGKDISHIEQASLEDVKNFFFRYYRPNNAVLVVAGPLSAAEVKPLAEKWFGPIEPGPANQRQLPQEPPQSEKRSHTKPDKVPANAIYKAFKMASRTGPGFYEADLISDILGRDQSSRLYRRLVRGEQKFTEVKAYQTNSTDPGLLVVSGKTASGISAQEGEKYLDEVLYELAEKPVSPEELEKVQNQSEFTLEIAEVELLHKAINLAYFEVLGDAEQINHEAEKIRAVSPQSLHQTAQELLQENKSSVLYYEAES